jgi:surface antigen Omp85-like protein
MAMTMFRSLNLPIVRLGVVFVAFAAGVASLSAQTTEHHQPPPPPIKSRDSVSLAAGKRYEAGSFTRFFLGNTYRDLWTTPVRAPVLDLEHYAGGLKPLKEGGGNQSRNLRLGAADGGEYVFRPVDKVNATPPERLRGTAIAKIFRDQVSGLFPAAGIIIAPIAEAAGVLHATPAFTVMPNDSALGKFRKDFTGRLATLEEYPVKGEEGPGFAGAADVIATDELLPLLDSIPAHLVDDRSFLAARLLDLLVDDTDRHHGNWKWARFGPSKAARWVAIPRDRDHAFNQYDGPLARVGSLAVPFLSRFEGKYQSIRVLSDNSRQLDRRFLSGLEKPVWDSIALAMKRRVTDAVIDSAVRTLPPEYRSVAPSFAARLKQRRDGLPAVADKFYRVLAEVVDVHATDAPDRATVTYLPGGIVDVQLQSGDREPYYHRRFDPRETAEVRVYLHGGDDVGVVKGDATSNIRVRVIGGNGTNQLVDSSNVAGSGRARLYDIGRTSGFYYGPDSMRDTLFSRRPWVNDTGVVAYPSKDYGTSLTPVAGFGTGGLGLVPRVGLRWTKYGFRHEPFSTQVGLDAEYSTGVDGYRLSLLGDHRLETSRVHFTALGRMSDFELVNFFGYGNRSDGQNAEDTFRVDQRQWQLRPAVAVSLGRRESDLSLGPVFQYSTTASNTGRVIATDQPYGYGNFAEAGVRVGLRYDGRDRPQGATRGFFVDMSSSAFPAMWDVKSAFSQLSGSAATYFKLNLPLHPVLALRGGGRKVWGDAPFHEAAFLGGVDTLTGTAPQRYAGDASVFGNSELRIPVASIRSLLPIDIGVLGFADAGRVYVDGRSPGGWHGVAGGGLWFGILDQSTGVSVVLTSSKDSRVVVGTGLRF